MRAVLLDKITEAKDIVLSECPVPETRPGWVLVKVKAFGLNHSEKLLRQSEIRADYIRKPVIPGIECVGEIADPSDSGLAVGQKVAALMGGMGRSFNGSYAEYALLPGRIVFTIESKLPWEALGAVPETYYTAWGSLFECLHLTADDTLLIRGATCALGYAAIQIAGALGCKVIATTHREEKLPLIADGQKFPVFLPGHGGIEFTAAGNIAGESEDIGPGLYHGIDDPGNLHPVLLRDRGHDDAADPGTVDAADLFQSAVKGTRFPEPVVSFPEAVQGQLVFLAAVPFEFPADLVI